MKFETTPSSVRDAPRTKRTTQYDEEVLEAPSTPKKKANNISAAVEAPRVMR
ncbi:hypothetical protein B0H10DRAFT_2209858 [Mycena sp. CBHHK59/15]|nr:hypothetical protein B0H10DRAFT_2209858 [Mycena sp. CBHHK59/15]